MKELRTWSLALLSSAGVGGSVLRRSISARRALVAATVVALLVAALNDEDAGVIVGGAEVAFDGVGEAEFSAQLLEDAGAEAAGEDLVHDAEGVVVGVAALGAEADDEDVGLVDVILFDEVDGGFGVG